MADDLFGKAEKNSRDTNEKDIAGQLTLKRDYGRKWLMKNHTPELKCQIGERDIFKKLPLAITKYTYILENITMVD